MIRVIRGRYLLQDKELRDSLACFLNILYVSPPRAAAVIAWPSHSRPTPRASMSVVQPPTVERRYSAERTCGVCLEGVYATRLETDAYAGPGMLRRVGIQSEEREVLWHVESCNNCGHVQIFRRDFVRETPD